MNKRRRWLFALLPLTIFLGWGAWRLTHPTPAPLPAVVLKGYAPVAPESPPPPTPMPVSVLLPNGLRIFVLEDHTLPTVHFRLSVRAGRVFEPLPGLATLTASLMTEGTQSRSEAALADQVEQDGASLSCKAGEERTILRLNGLSQDASALLSLLSDVALHPAFDPSRISRLQFQQSALESQSNNSVHVEDRLSGPMFYGKTPFADQPATGADFASLTQSDVIGFFVRCYVPSGAVLGIVGDFRSSDVLALASKEFSGWPIGAGAPPLPPGSFSPKTTTRTSLADWKYASRSILTFQCPGVARSDPDFLPLVVSNQLLGGYSSGRLDQNLRESQGYTYSASSSLDAPAWPGLWSAHVTVPVEDTGATVDTVLAELVRLREEPVPPAELARAEQSLIGCETLVLEQPEALLDREAEVYEYSLPPDYWRTYPERVRAVTAADVRRMANKYFADGRIQIIALGPRSKIERTLSHYGPVDDYDDRGYASQKHKPVSPRLPAWLNAF